MTITIRSLLAASALATASTALAHPAFSVASSDLPAGATVPAAQVYRGYGCTGSNQSPALTWHDAPAGTQSYSVTLFDPDANHGKGWWHWLVTGIPANRHGLAAGAGDTPGAMDHGALQWRNDFGAHAYGGPCPPRGDPSHHYVLTVYALDTAQLTLPPDASPAAVKRAITAHALTHASITAHYARP